MATVSSTLAFGIGYSAANAGYQYGTTGFSNSSIIFGYYSALYPYNGFIRFGPIEIPNGATITSAYIRFSPAGSGTGDGTCNATIKLADSDTAPVSHASFDAKTWSATTVAWNNIPKAEWTAPYYDSPDITDLIAEKVEDAGWVEGDHILLGIFDNGSETNVARYAYNSSAGIQKNPMLVITFTANNKWYGQPKANTDMMAYHRFDPPNEANNSFDSGVNEMPWGQSTLFAMVFWYDNGIRFPECNVPRYAQITSAELMHFSTSVSYTWDVEHDIYLNDTNDAAAPTTQEGWEALVKTTASYHNTISTDISPWTWYTIASGFTAPIQEVIIRRGWTIGNDIMMMNLCTASSSAGQYLHFEGAFNNSIVDTDTYGYSPVLKIEFTPREADYRRTKIITTKWDANR